MKNSQRGTAHHTHISTLFRSVSQSRGRIDLSSLEDDLADIEERYVPRQPLRGVGEEQWESRAEGRRGRERRAA